LTKHDPFADIFLNIVERDKLLLPVFPRASNQIAEVRRMMLEQSFVDIVLCRTIATDRDDNDAIGRNIVGFDEQLDTKQL
jgi:hypothetical protein